MAEILRGVDALLDRRERVAFVATLYQRGLERHALKLATTEGVDWQALCEPETYGDGLWQRYMAVGLAA